MALGSGGHLQLSGPSFSSKHPPPTTCKSSSGALTTSPVSGHLRTWSAHCLFPLSVINTDQKQPGEEVVYLI